MQVYRSTVLDIPRGSVLRAKRHRLNVKSISSGTSCGVLSAARALHVPRVSIYGPSVEFRNKRRLHDKQRELLCKVAVQSTRRNIL